MGTISKANFMKAVRVELDRNRAFSPLITSTQEDPDTLELEEVIEAQIIPALTWCIEHAPLGMLWDAIQEIPVTPNNNGEYEAEANDVLYLELPDDFLRLALFKMYGWTVGVTEAITADDPRAALFGSKYAGICGNDERPRCLLTFMGYPVKRVLVIYSASRDNDIAAAERYYVPKPSEDLQGNLPVPERLLPAAVSMCAALVCRTMQDDKGVQLLEQKVNVLLGIV